MILWENKKNIFDLRKDNDSSRRIGAVNILEKFINKIAKITAEQSAGSLSVPGEKHSSGNIITRKNSNWRCC